MKDLILKNRHFYLFVLLLIFSGGILLFLNTKVEVTMWTNIHHTPFLDFLSYNINMVGEAFFTLLVLLVIGIIRDWKLALKAALCFLSAAIVVQFIKHVVFPGELRPTQYFPLYIPDFDLRLLDGVIQLKTESFPSGHTGAAFSIMTFLALYMPDKRWNWLLVVPALLVAYARVYMSQHFVTDVYAGMIIGVVTTSLVYAYYPKKWEP